MKTFLALLGIVGLTLVCAESGSAQPTASNLDRLRQELNQLKQEQAETKKELQEIRMLLQTNRPSQPVDARNAVLNIGGLPTQGDQNAKLTIVEFSDYQCPFCGRFVQETLPQIENAYIKSGAVRYVFSDLPLEAIHPQALKAAEAARCAGEQGRYWEMHNQLFKNQAALSPRELSLHAQFINLDQPKFQQCLATDKYADQLHQSIVQAQSVGIDGTPAFLIGLTIPGKEQMRVVQVMFGAQPYSSFKAVIDRLLTSQN
jgi:protein-disulfide isomerase